MSSLQVTYLAILLFFLYLTWYGIQYAAELYGQTILLPPCMTKKTWGNVSLPMLNYKYHNNSLCIIKCSKRPSFFSYKNLNIEATYSLQWHLWITIIQYWPNTSVGYIRHPIFASNAMQLKHPQKHQNPVITTSPPPKLSFTCFLLLPALQLSQAPLLIKNWIRQVDA